jgi:uncharacterized membrane protein
VKHFGDIAYTCYIFVLFIFLDLICVTKQQRQALFITELVIIWVLLVTNMSYFCFSKTSGRRTHHAVLFMVLDTLALICSIALVALTLGEVGGHSTLDVKYSGFQIANRALRIVISSIRIARFQNIISK